MPFWKQSDDPWDRKPGKRFPESKEAKESKENPVDTLKQWNEDRKATAREREEAKRLPPEKCPWCGKDMDQGFILGGRDMTRWYPGVYKFDPLRSLSGDSLDILTDSYGFTNFKIAWLCRDCKKMVFDISYSEPYAYSAEESQETKEEEEQSET